MNEDKPLMDEGKEPERPSDAQGDVTGLYTWANLEGARYRDFSADRDQARSIRRQRKGPPRTAGAASTTSAVGPRRLLTAVMKTPARKSQAGQRRWSALNSIFDPIGAVSDAAARPSIVLEASSLAFVSLAGGVGKTVLAASIARSLAAQGQRILLVDTQPCGMLPLIFGTRELKQGNSVTIAFEASAEQLDVLTLRNRHTEADTEPEAGLLEQLVAHAEGSQQILIDAASGSIEMMQQILRFVTNVVVVLTPDMASVMSLQPLQALLESADDEGEDTPRVHYLLNQFDGSSRLHVAIRKALNAQLNGRMLPFVLPYSKALQEALAEGTTLEGYAPDDPLLKELHHLADWVAELEHHTDTQLPARLWKGQSC